MWKSVLYVTLIWIAIAFAIFILYLLREVSPVKEIIAWAISIWPLLALLGAVALGISGWILKHDFGKKAKPLPTGFGFQPIICEPEISIVIDKCSVLNYGQSDQAIEVALTLKVKSPPVNITDVQLYMGDEMLKLLSPTMPITQRNNKECYVAKYKLSLETIYKVTKDRRDKYRICVVAMGRKFPSKVFSINNP